MIYALHFYYFVLCYRKVSLSFVAMWCSRLLVHYEEINILSYEKLMISLYIKDLETRLSMCCKFCGGYHGGLFCEEQFIVKEIEQEVVNIDYHSQLQNILDDFLMSNQVPFENLKFSVVVLLRKHMSLSKSWLRWRLSVRILRWTTIQK